MKRITWSLIAAAVAATLLLTVSASSRQVSAAGLGFMAWGVSPYLYLAGINRWVKTAAATRMTLVIAALTGLLGIWMIADATLLSLDAQSGLVFLFAPLWQWFLLLIASMPLYFSNRNFLRTDV